MKRAVFALAIAIGLAIGTMVPASALGLSQATLRCDDGTTSTMVVDTTTLVGLTQAVQAMIDYPAGLTCTLAQVPLVSFGTVAVAANEPFVVGGGRYLLPCDAPGLPNFGGGGGGAPTQDAAPDGFYWVNLAINAHQKGTDFVGTLNETIPEHQCVPHGHFTSKPTCLTVAGTLAYVTTIVTQTSQETTNNFFPAIEVIPGESTRFSFEDFGNPGHQPDGVDDTLNGVYTVDDSDCATFDNTPAPAVDLVHGNITVHE